MSSYAQNAIVAFGLPFGLAAVLVGVFVIWRPAWLRRAFERHGRALRRTVDVLAAVLLAGYAVRALRHHDGR